MPKPLKVPSLARSVQKPEKVSSLARSVPKPLMVAQAQACERAKGAQRASLVHFLRTSTDVVTHFFIHSMVVERWHVERSLIYHSLKLTKFA